MKPPKYINLTAIDGVVQELIEPCGTEAAYFIGACVRHVLEHEPKEFITRYGTYGMEVLNEYFTVTDQ